MYRSNLSTTTYLILLHLEWLALDSEIAEGEVRLIFIGENADT
eukprot:SAG11_NODE_35076_length_268_cov_1.165680_1_plen_42_part_10